jgi:hypothetical protein
LEETVHELAGGLRRIGFADADFRNSALIRLNVLDRLRRQGLLDEDLCWVGVAGPAPVSA